MVGNCLRIPREQTLRCARYRFHDRIRFLYFARKLFYFLFIFIVCASISPYTFRNSAISNNQNSALIFALGGVTAETVHYFNQTRTLSSIDDEITWNTRHHSLNEIFVHAGKRGLGGGLSGAVAGVIQVFTLMWLRTIISYQCRYGTTFAQALGTLLKDGGVARLYRGLGFALIQAPLMRFISTAANDGVESFLANFELTRAWGPGRSTIVASLVVGFWRIIMMPIDTMKTVLQVDSSEGFRSLIRKVRAGKIGTLYNGALAIAIASALGHFPWFYTYNFLSNSDFLRALIPMRHLRNAGIGLIASIISDTCVNAIRVVKTTKQSIGTKHAISYMETIRMILAADGWKGLFGRGLRTRIVANAIQSIVFTVIWRSLADCFRKKTAEDASLRNEE